MSRSVSAPVKVCRTVSLIVALVLALSWTTVAYAQVPADAQYDSPTARASGNPAASIGAGGSAGSGGASGGSGGFISNVPGGGVGSGGALGGSGGSIGVLPFTGGELSLPLIGLSAVVLGSIVLLGVEVRRVIRRSRR